MESNTNFTQKAKRDYKLVQQAQQNNDQKAFNKLMKYYENSIYFMMLKMTNNADDAKDLSLIAFEKAFRNIKSYTPVYAFSTWLFKIASNNCIDFLRRERKNTQSVDLYDDNNELIEQIKTITSDEPSPEDSIIKEQHNVKIRNYVNKLKPKDKKIIELHYFNELGYIEIAKLLKMPVGTVKGQLFRAREKLQRSMRNVEAMN